MPIIITQFFFVLKILKDYVYFINHFKKSIKLKLLTNKLIREEEKKMKIYFFTTLFFQLLK